MIRQLNSCTGFRPESGHLFCGTPLTFARPDDREEILEPSVFIRRHQPEKEVVDLLELGEQAALLVG